MISFKTNSKHYPRIVEIGIILAGIMLVVLGAFGWPTAQRFEGASGQNITKAPGANMAQKLPEAGNSLLKGQGDMALVQDGILQVLEGSTGHLTPISQSGFAQKPLWSHDGQWLAYLWVSNQGDNSGSLWLVRRDGTQSHQVQGLPDVVRPDTYAWSPTENRLAVNCQGIWLVKEQGLPDQVVKPEPGGIYGIAWSPDGKQIAYSVTLPYAQEEVQNRDDALYTLDVRTGQTVQQLVSPGAGIDLAAWWPDSKGILYWNNPGHGVSAANDGLDLCSFRLGSKEPRRLTAGLIKPCWLSLSSDGRLLSVAGTGRELWTNKWLEVCDIRGGTAVRVNIPAGSVPADPAFSPDAKRITFVAADDLGSSEYPTKEKIDRWTNNLTLWVANPDGSEARPLTKAGNNIQEPQWSKDGKYIMYISNNYLWMIDAQGNERHKIAGPFSTTEAQNYYYSMGSYVLAWYKG